MKDTVIANPRFKTDGESEAAESKIKTKRQNEGEAVFAGVSAGRSGSKFPFAAGERPRGILFLPLPLPRKNGRLSPSR